MDTGNETSTQVGSPHTDERWLIEWLRDRDVFCPLCNYNVRNLTTPRCPECGNGLRLVVALAEPYFKAWIALTVALCAGGGMGLFFLYAVCREGFPIPGDRLLNYAISLHILLIPPAVGVLVLRRRFQRLSRTAQWVCAYLGIGLVVIGFATICCRMP